MATPRKRRGNKPRPKGKETLDPATLKELRSRVEASSVRAVARALEISEPTIARAIRGEAITVPYARLLTLMLAPSSTPTAPVQAAA